MSNPASDLKQPDDVLIVGGARRAPSGRPVAEDTNRRAYAR